MRFLRAFSLIEVVLAGGIIATVIGALFAVAGMRVRLAAQSESRVIAMDLAEEGIAIARQVRDSNFTAQNCSVACPDWRTGLVALFQTQPASLAEALPVVKSTHSDSVTGFGLKTVALSSDVPCSDAFRYDSTDGKLTPLSGSTPSEAGIFCRRLIIEEVNHAALPESLRLASRQVLRIRSQVSWLGQSKMAWQPPVPLAAENPCGKNSEWCVEVVTYLTEGSGQ